MATGLNMKTVFTSDTKGFEQGAKTVKKGIKDLEGVSNTALSSIGDLFGVDTGKISQMSSAIVGLGAKLRDCGSTGGKAIGSLITSMGSLGAGIAGLGIGAAVVGFKNLQAAAESFSNTVDGINMKMATQQWTSTYTQAMMDAEKSTSNFWINTSTRWKTGMSRLGAITGGILSGNGVSSTIAADKQAMENAGKAAGYKAQMVELEKQQIANSVIIAQNDAKISDLTRTARDTNASSAEREQARAEASTLIQQNYNLQYGILSKMVSYQAQINDLSSNTLDDNRNLANLQVQLAGLDQQRAQQMTSLDRVGRSIANSTKETAASISAMLPDLTEANRVIDASISGTDLNASISPIASLPLLTYMQNEKATLQVPATIIPQVNEDTKKALTDVSDELSSMMEDAFQNVGESLGSLIGDLATGGDAWSNFADTALSALGDMAISVGKMAIATGVATLGIKAALESLNGYVAIAAGVALVAIGTAVKTGLSNVASGNYNSSSASTVASSSYGTTASQTSSYGREMAITVSGTWEVEGSKLVAVLNNESRRNLVTT